MLSVLKNINFYEKGLLNFTYIELTSIVCIVWTVLTTNLQFIKFAVSKNIETSIAYVNLANSLKIDLILVWSQQEKYGLIKCKFILIMIMIINLPNLLKMKKNQREWEHKKKIKKRPLRDFCLLLFNVLVRFIFVILFDTFDYLFIFAFVVYTH